MKNYNNDFQLNKDQYYSHTPHLMKIYKNQPFQERKHQQHLSHPYPDYSKLISEQQKNRKIFVWGILIIIILIIIIPPIEIFLLNQSSSYGESDLDFFFWENNKNDGDPYKISGFVTENDGEYIITISNVKNKIYLENIKFELFNLNKKIVFALTVETINPAPFTKGSTTIYALPSSSNPVHNSSGITISNDHYPEDYKNCYLTYLDQNSDGLVTVDDSIIIHKDYNNDNIIEIEPKFTFKIKNKKDGMLLNKFVL